MRLACLFIALPVLSIAQDAAAIYQSRCASCHDSPTGRIPPTSALKAMNAARIIAALGGVMKAQAEGLSSAEKYALVIYLATPESKPAAPPPASAMCATSKPFDPSKGPRWNGWGADPANTRFQPAAEAGIAAVDVPKLKLKWAYRLGEESDAKGQPAVAGGRLFLGTDSGVDALDASSGCIYWSFHSGSGVRTAISVTKSAVYFGDRGADAYAVDSSTGKLIWKQHVDDHFAAVITGAPLLHGGTLYVPVSSYEEALAPGPTYECCTFRGSVVAIEASTGKRLWKAYTVADAPQPTVKSKAGLQMRGPSGAPVWSAPTFDEKRNAIYVATGDNYSDPPTTTSDAVVAIDARLGKSCGRSSSLRMMLTTPRVMFRARSIAPRPTARIRISASRRFWFLLAAENGRWYSARNRGWFTPSIPIMKAHCCGRFVPGRAESSGDSVGFGCGP